MNLGRVFEKHQDLRLRLCELENDRKIRLERQDYIRFQAKEIEAAGLKPGEDLALLEEKNIKGNARRLSELAGAAYETLYEGKESMLGELSAVSSQIREIRKIDTSLAISPEGLDSLIFSLEDKALLLRDYLGKISYDPGETR